MEVCTRIRNRGNDVAIRWAPAHQRIPGNERADECAKAAADLSATASDVPDEYRWETSLAHMTRAATEARTRDTQERIASHVCPGRGYRPPRGQGLRRKLLRRTRKPSAGRYYQLLSGDAAIGLICGTISKEPTRMSAGGAVVGSRSRDTSSSSSAGHELRRFEGCGKK